MTRAQWLQETRRMSFERTPGGWTEQRLTSSLSGLTQAEQEYTASTQVPMPIFCLNCLPRCKIGYHCSG